MSGPARLAQNDLRDDLLTAFAIPTIMVSPVREVLLVGLGGVGAICKLLLTGPSLLVD